MSVHNVMAHLLVYINVCMSSSCCPHLHLIWLRSDVVCQDTLLFITSVSLNAVSPSAHVHLYQVQSPYKLVQVETPRTFQQGDPWEGRV